jgi:hypothetical protein
MRTLLLALAVASACRPPQIGYVDPRVPAVQLVTTDVARARKALGGLLHVPIDPAVADEDAVRAFLARAGALHAAYASDLVIHRGDCAARVLPIAQTSVHDEEVSQDVTETEQVPATHCETVSSWVAGSDDSPPSFESHEECHTDWETKTTTHTETHTEQVTDVVWRILVGPPACARAAVGRSFVEGTIYAAE